MFGSFKCHISSEINLIPGFDIDILLVSLAFSEAMNKGIFSRQTHPIERLMLVFVKPKEMKQWDPPLRPRGSIFSPLSHPSPPNLYYVYYLSALRLSWLLGLSEVTPRVHN